MKNPELYHKTVEILVQAYFNDTLERKNCYACAVGNIISHNMGIKYLKDDKGIGVPLLFWEGCIPYSNTIDSNARVDNKFPSWFNKIKRGVHVHNERAAIEQIKSTGYSIRNLNLIEICFERGARKGQDKMFNGLMSVIDCLDKIHGNANTEITSTSKQRFNKNDNVAALSI